LENDVQKCDGGSCPKDAGTHGNVCGPNTTNFINGQCTNKTFDDFGDNFLGVGVPKRYANLDRSNTFAANGTHVFGDTGEAGYKNWIKSQPNLTP